MSAAAGLDPDVPGLPEISVEDLISRLTSTVVAQSVLAFDADGTLWSGDIGMDTYQAVLGRRLLRSEAGPALAREAALAGLPIEPDPNAQARRLFDAFEQGRYAEDRAFAMMAWSLAGSTVEQVRALASEVVDEMRLSARVLPETAAVLRWANTRGLAVVVVSASPAIVVEVALAALGLPVMRVFGMRVVTTGGVLQPALLGNLTYGPGKAETLRVELPDAIISAAFGDSAFDLPMLRSAIVPVAVRPKPELVARGAECPGLISLAPAATTVPGRIA